MAIKIAVGNQSQRERPLLEFYRNFRSTIYRKKPLLLFLGVLIVCFVLTKLLISQVGSLAVLEFVFIAVLFGFAPAYFLRRMFKFENIVDWVTTAGALGILLIPFTSLVAGWLDINLVFSHSILVFYFGGVAGFICLIVFTDKDVIDQVVSFRGLNCIDALIYASLIGYTALLTLLNFSQVRAFWDAFTYWGLAAKFVYQFQQLPNASLDVFTYLRYTAFHPINLALVYNLYGTMVEQYASWVNVFINLLAMLLIYGRFTGSSMLKKAFILMLLIFTSFGAIDATCMLTIYADTLCAFIVLIYVLVLINENGLSTDLYSQRAALILSLATALFFIKSLMAILTVMLIVFWLFYDYDFIRKRVRDLAGRWDLWVVIGATATIHFLRYWYVAHTLRVEHTVAEAGLMIPTFTSLSATIEYLGQLLEYFVRRTPYLSGLWLIGMGSIFLIAKKRLYTKKYLAVYLVALGLFVFFIIVFIVYERRLSGGSLMRYTSIVAYLVPLLFSFVSLDVPLRLVRPLIAIFSAITILLFRQTFLSIPQAALLHPVPGSYSTYLKNHAGLADQVLTITGKEARILIADDADGLFSNMNTPAIYIRYFLMENSVGGQYHSVAGGNLIDFGTEFDADYILILSYDNSLDNCESVFEAEGNYLVNLKDDLNQDPSKCRFTRKSVFEVITQK